MNLEFFFYIADAEDGEVFLINRTSYSMEILFEPITAPSSAFPHVVTITPTPNDGVGDLLVTGNDRIVDIDNLTPGQTYSITIRRNEVPGPVRQITTSMLSIFYLFFLKTEKGCRHTASCLRRDETHECMVLLFSFIFFIFLNHLPIECQVRKFQFGILNSSSTQFKCLSIL